MERKLIKEINPEVQYFQGSEFLTSKKPTYFVHILAPSHTVHIFPLVHKNSPLVHSKDRCGQGYHDDRHTQYYAVSTCPPGLVTGGQAVDYCREYTQHWAVGTTALQHTTLLIAYFCRTAANSMADHITLQHPTQLITYFYSTHHN